MEVTLRHDLTYTTEGAVDVATVARALLANERLVREALSVIEACAPGLHIARTRISVGHVSNASPLKNLLIAALVLQWQDDLVREVPDLIEQLTGFDVPQNMETLLTLLVCAIAIYAASAAVERLTPGKSNKALQQELESSKAIAAKLLQMTPEQVQKAIEQKVTEPKRVALWSRVRDFFAPARVDETAEVVTKGPYKIGRGAINELPEDGEISPEQGLTYELKGTELEIHRADRDQNEHGWRAVLQDVSEKKVRLVLATELDPGSLFGATVVRGDVVVVEAVSDDGTSEPSVYHLLNVDLQK